MLFPRAPLLPVLARVVVLVACSAPSLAAAQDALGARLLTFEDARDLSTAAQAAFTEGMKSADPRVRARAVRAAGRFETPTLLTQILPLLADPNADVRHWAAIAAASSARIVPGQSIEALLAALATTVPADWGVFAAQLGRLTMPGPEVFARVEKALASALPAAASAQAGRPARAVARTADARKLEGAARGLEALTRVNGRVAPLSADTRARLAAVVTTPEAPGSRSRVRARRLALSALRNERAVDGPLVRVAAQDADDEVRRLAVLTAAAVVVADASILSDADRETVLTDGLKDLEPRVRLEAVRGWGRHRQAQVCQPVLTAVTDPSVHVALQAIDLLGAGCAASALVPQVLQKEAEALPASGATWHRAAHALVSLAKASPADVRTLLPRFVGHPTWQVRRYAARTAGQTGAVEPLVRLGRDAHDNVREAALAELARLNRPEALPVAYDALARPDYQLVITAAQALEAETDKPKATAALLAALGRITREGRDTSRDPRVAIMTRLIETGAAADAPGISAYLRDFDPKVAALAVTAISRWTGAVRDADPRLRPSPPPDVATLEPLRRQHLRITMARGGVIELRLLVDEASATVLRIAELTRRGHYTGLTFHRVEPTFVLQGGSPGANEYMGDGPYLRDEPGVAHNRGTVGISTRGRDTGDGQLFINLIDSPRLDHAYTVFAVVERGMDVADTVLEGDVMARVELVAAPRP
jgi:cyclophilin family peptidyl-prolyl cis-trans isomerase/HEAT repeat protein